jgi:glycosyltransferase involved in cell wall biosynthesis
MRLLVATDHRFHLTPEGVFDTYCFDRAFFDDYRAVFDEVLVAARLIEGPRPEGSARSDGDGVEFIQLPNTKGPAHVLFSGLLFRPHLRSAIETVDAVCVRIPSSAGRQAVRIADRLDRPAMFEMIGDPEAALDARQYGWLIGVMGRISGRQLRTIPPRCVAGSYVSREHLQRKYPPGPDTAVESISSIRLPESWLRPPRQFADEQRRLHLVLVASLVPVKWHEILIRGMHAAVDLGADVDLTLAGGGPLREDLQALAEELGLQKRIRFLGHVSDTDRLLQVLDNSDVFVMTSASEGMPRAMIEAMARGLPAIGSDAGGISELLEDDQLFPPGDFVRLGHMLYELQQSPGRLTEYSRRSSTIAREFTEDILSQRRRRLLRVLKDEAVKRS